LAFDVAKPAAAGVQGPTGVSRTKPPLSDFVSS
jgi:hypothetical protein